MRGPWDSEPDHLEFEAHGFACTITRHSSHGHLCGYVDIPSGHPWNGVHYGALHEYHKNLQVHGGLTWSDWRAPSTEDSLPGGAWRIGFDCSHHGDLSPGLTFGSRIEYEEYRDINYVRAECEDLAKQAAEAAGVAS